MPRFTSVIIFLALSSSAALAEVCPKFVCGPGNFLYGKFTDPKDPLKEPSDPLWEGFFTPGQMYDYVTRFNISDLKIETPQLDCYEFCVAKNMLLPSNADPAKKAKYWMFEETCLEGTCAKCTCAGASVKCTGGGNMQQPRARVNVGSAGENVGRTWGTHGKDNRWFDDGSF
ncbi:unnamed protein product [Closterium sp. NIES-65]|nr:unnamed protein product [Closterium sp. NIES-65]